MAIAERTRSTHQPGLNSFGGLLLSRPLVVAAIVFSCGILLASLPIAAAVTAALLLGALVFARSRSPRLLTPVLICTMFVLAGGLRARIAQSFPANDISKWANGQYVTVTGVISRDVGASQDEITCFLNVRGLLAPDQVVQPAAGEVFAHLKRKPGAGAPEFGDVIEARGRLEPPPPPGNAGEFDYAAYLERQGVRSVISAKRPASWRTLSTETGTAGWFVRAAVRCRDSLRSTFAVALPPGEAGLMTGIVLGGRADIPPAITDDFTVTGSVHILSASGMNVAMTAALLLWIGKLLRAPKRFAYCGAMAALFFYTVMAGATPSVVRADIMCSVFMLAFIIQREPDMPCAIAASAIILLAISPNDLFDIGFQLSFATVIAIVALVPVVQAPIQSIKCSSLGLPDWLAALSSGIIRYVLTVVSVTIAAQLGSMPLIAQYFNQVSLVALPANILILGPIDALMRIGFAVWIVGAASLPAARVLAGILASPILAAMIGAARLFAGVGQAAISIPSPGWLLIGVYYAALIWTAVMVNSRYRSTGIGVRQ